MNAAQTVKGSQMHELCLQILDAREPGTIRDYEKALKRYERRLAAGRHKEVEIQQQARDLLGRPFTRLGFFTLEDGQAVATYRPQKPTPHAYRYMPYSRDFGVSHASALGLLASPRYNREIRPDRVERYRHEMLAGRWRDLLSDPISITADGHVLNGQHRIAAANDVDWSKVEFDPSFLVLWGVAPSEAQFADGSRRTAHDERTIARNLLVGVEEGGRP